MEYYPVCAGKTNTGEKIILYQNDQKKTYIQLPDGELWALSPESIIESTFNIDLDQFEVKLESPQWSGTFTGTSKDLIEAEPR